MMAQDKSEKGFSRPSCFAPFFSYYAEASQYMLEASRSSLDAAEKMVSAADPSGLFGDFFSATRKAFTKPDEAMAAGVELAWRSRELSLAALDRFVRLGDAVAPEAGSRKKQFADPDYEKNPFYYVLARRHALWKQYVTDLIDASGVSGVQEKRARFAGDFLVDLFSPENTFLGNPAAIKKALQSGGESLARGVENFVHDLYHNDGFPSMVDRSGFALGENLAATPGKVVYRSDVIELIQYSPQSADVYETPLLFCPSLINKYYMLDLSPGKSLIEWAVRQGHNSFAISYKNPEPSMRDIGFAEYLNRGFLDAVRVVRNIAQSPSANTVSVCLGGTFTAMGAAYNKARGDESINSATFLNTPVDFTEPGVLGLFVDEATIARIEKETAKKGVLESNRIAKAFTMLRPQDFILRNLVRNWLMGDPPPAVDMTAWSEDPTNLTARMASEMLSSLFLDNAFAEGTFDIGGSLLSARDVDIDTYVLASVTDHLVPWTSAYQATQLFKGQTRFVLSSFGHITGIINPPSPRSRHWTGDTAPSDPLEWKERAVCVDDTWWRDWTEWIGQRAGKRVAAPASLGNAQFPPIAEAPGKYVRG